MHTLPHADKNNKRTIQIVLTCQTKKMWERKLAHLSPHIRHRLYTTPCLLVFFFLFLSSCVMCVTRLSSFSLRFILFFLLLLLLFLRLLPTEIQGEQHFLINTDGFWRGKNIWSKNKCSNIIPELYMCACICKFEAVSWHCLTLYFICCRPWFFFAQMWENIRPSPSFPAPALWKMIRELGGRLNKYVRIEYIFATTIRFPRTGK